MTGKNNANIGFEKQILDAACGLHQENLLGEIREKNESTIGWDM